MTEAMFGELMAVVGMANETNRLANGYRVPVDAAFEHPVIAAVSARHRLHPKHRHSRRGSGTNLCAALSNDRPPGKLLW